MPNVPTSGIRYLTLRVTDGTRSQTFPCLNLVIPNPSDPERVEVFVEGVLRSVLRGNNAVGDFSFDLPIGAFMDASTATPDQIFSGTGLGAAWIPINDSLTDCRVDSAFRVFTFTSTLDTRSLGGGVTTRTWQGYAARPVSITRADPNAISFAGRVYGSVTDAITG